MGSNLDTGVPRAACTRRSTAGTCSLDDIFLYPMLTLRRPEMTRALLYYRHRRLNEARAAGLDGAMFPWQSGSDGREESASELYNLRTDK